MLGAGPRASPPAQTDTRLDFPDNSKSLHEQGDFVADPIGPHGWISLVSAVSFAKFYAGPRPPRPHELTHGSISRTTRRACTNRATSWLIRSVRMVGSRWFRQSASPSFTPVRGPPRPHKLTHGSISRTTRRACTNRATSWLIRSVRMVGSRWFRQSASPSFTPVRGPPRPHELTHGSISRTTRRACTNRATSWLIRSVRMVGSRWFRQSASPSFTPVRGPPVRTNCNTARFLGQALTSQAIRGTTDSHTVLNKHMGIDLSGANIFVPEQFLNGADIGAGSEQMGGEGMA